MDLHSCFHVGKFLIIQGIFDMKSDVEISRGKIKSSWFVFYRTSLGMEV